MWELMMAGMISTAPDIFKTPAMIKDARNDEYTNGIVDSMHNTFISTCLQNCHNFRDFFVNYVRAWNLGRRDFGRSSFTRSLPTGLKNLVKLVYTLCA